MISSNLVAAGSGGSRGGRRSGAVPVGLLDAAGGGLARRLGGELLPGDLASGGLASGLLGTGHFVSERDGVRGKERGGAHTPRKQGENSRSR